jgi:hypothetical protein
MPTLIDSYSESNYSNSQGLLSARWQGQSFLNPTEIVLDSVVFYLSKYGSPISDAYISIYAMTGTFGASGVPTGSILAESDPLDVTTLTTSHALKTFNFSGTNRITLSASTHYCIVLHHAESAWPDFIYNSIDLSSPTHPGDWFQSNNGTSWSHSSSGAVANIFYIYGVSATSDPTLTGISSITGISTLTL